MRPLPHLELPPNPKPRARPATCRVLIGQAVFPPSPSLSLANNANARPFLDRCLKNIMITETIAAFRIHSRAAGAVLEAMADDFALEEAEEKPQHKFKHVLADNSSAPFVHLAISENGVDAQHPFSSEIHKLLENVSEAPISFNKVDDGPPPLDGPYIWVETREQLQDLVEILSKEKEFAVDIEHHSIRSFLGFIALLQISTDKQDFLIDAIALHDQLSILRPVFANPNICKIFHGADSDSMWLQRDFHIYIVNLFDTARACDVLSKSQRSLAYLLQSYCDVSTNKTFQRADWRQRPLSEAMLHYARVDAHYLLYIARRLCMELTQEPDGVNKSFPDNGLYQAMRRSHLMSLQLYEKDRSSASPWTSAASILARSYYNRDFGSSSSLTDTQFQELVRKLCIWRDSLARSEDVSLRYILSDAAILALAKDCPLSHEMILSTIAAAGSLPQDSLLSVVAPASPSLVVKREICTLAAFLRQASDASRLELVIEDAQIRPENEASVPQSGLQDRMLSDQKDPKRSRQKQPNTCKKEEPQKSGQTQKSRYRFVRQFACKSPVYDNCRIFAGDGCLLCYCDRKKIEWYLQRGLAESLNEDPPAVRLLFEPKGRPEDANNEFYIQRKCNRCVGCGETAHYLRYRIIPFCYRQHFPEHLKSHRSHDIVLLCVDCHEIAHQAAEQFKRQIAAEYGVPLSVNKELEAEADKCAKKNVTALSGSDVGRECPQRIRNAVMALLFHGSSMPIQRKEELENVIRTHFDGRHATEQEMIALLMVGMRQQAQNRLLKNLHCRSSALSYSLAMDHEVNGQNPGMQSCFDLDKITYFQRMPSVDQKSGVKFFDEGAQECSKTEMDGRSTIITTTSMPLKVSNFRAGYNASHPHEEGKKMKSNFCPDTITSMKEEMSIIDQEFSAKLSEVTQAFTDAVIDANTTIMTSRRPSPCSASDHGSLSQVDDEKANANVPIRGRGRGKHRKHGKRVMDTILEKEGEDGIQSFCRKWRSVFVNALKPAFLPSGWDVAHRGRREFGDFSIYNPTRKVSQSEISSS
ncbi:hypothetical protein O6H91_06G090800 [Diphasiastrum complanatum]|uniref:Uncharacterized protein n=1 Tax=Diphasiastrum complanatum TaxID=34168 RepID=A0ACC2DH10_DIPCM|nr:hypothetical protein O6H91_06G090800 [Diphasiastrum complanatum]